MEDKINFSFGIITSPDSKNDINLIINSIRKQNIPNYEIIIVGSIKNDFDNDVKVIEFDESIKPGWITKKKNIITSLSNYENIVYLHDYVYLDDDWYKGYLKFGNKFEVAMNKILNQDKSRYHDWILWKDNNSNFDSYLLQKKQYLLPYYIRFLTRYMYISGTYWVAKKEFMTKFPLDESLGWGESEDVVWSKSIRDKIKFKLNTYSTVKFSKQKNIKWSIMKVRTLIYILFKIYIKK